MTLCSRVQVTLHWLTVAVAVACAFVFASASVFALQAEERGDALRCEMHELVLRGCLDAERAFAERIAKLEWFSAGACSWPAIVRHEALT